MLVIGLFASLAAPAGGAQRSRKVKEPYSSDPNQGRVSGWFGNDFGVFFGHGVRIPTKTSESVVSLVVTDDSGEDVAVAVWQNEDGRDPVFFCTTSGPVSIEGGKAVFVQPMIHASLDNQVCESPAAPTTGTVVAKLR
jgi:hypothetical protein